MVFSKEKLRTAIEEKYEIENREINRKLIENGTLTESQVEVIKNNQVSEMVEFEMSFRAYRDKPIISTHDQEIITDPVKQERRKPVVQKVGDPPPDCVPTWVSHKRGVPNIFLRTALFRIDKNNDDDDKGNEKFSYKSDPVWGPKTGVKHSLAFSGPRLKQSDLDIWKSLIHMMGGVDFGEEFAFTMTELKRVMTCHDASNSIGARYSGHEMDVIIKRLKIFTDVVIEITETNPNNLEPFIIYRDKLISSFDEDDHKTGREKYYYVSLPENMGVLFGFGMYTCVNAEIQKSIRSQGLAKWLHGYYSTHANPRPVSIKDLHEWSGSKSVSMSSFNKKLGNALDKLQLTGIDNPNDFSYTILKTEKNKSWRKLAVADHIVSVTKAGSASQQRHKQKKKS